MGVYTVSWEERVMREANQFWFYALSLSLFGAIYALFSPADTSKSQDEKKKKGGKTQRAGPARVNTSGLMKQIVVDGCDLLIPAELLGWYPTGDLVLGVTMVISTLLTGHGIWSRV